jgi:hypothetical protein
VDLCRLVLIAYLVPMTYCLAASLGPHCNRERSRRDDRQPGLLLGARVFFLMLSVLGLWFTYVGWRPTQACG